MHAHRHLYASQHAYFPTSGHLCASLVFCLNGFFTNVTIGFFPKILLSTPPDFDPSRSKLCNSVLPVHASTYLPVDVTKQLKANALWKIYCAILLIYVINCALKLLYYPSFSSTLTCQGHTQREQQRGTLNLYKGRRNVRHYLPRRLEHKMCGTLLFLCFRNLILVRISSYAATQIWPEVMSFSLACSWNDGMLHGTRRNGCC